MSAYYWSKLPHSFFDDRRIDSLEPDLYKMFIKLFLLAGIENGDKKTGALPEFEDIVYRLRYWNDEQLETAMVELQGRRLLSRIDGEWYVADFETVQAPEPAKERKRQERLRKARELGGVTFRDTEENRIEKNRKENNKNREEEEVEVEVEENIPTTTTTTSNSYSYSSPLFEEFCNVTGIQANKIDLSKAKEEIENKWVPGGVTVSEIREAATKLQEIKYKIAGPWSLTNTINMIRAQKKRVFA